MEKCSRSQVVVSPRMRHLCSDLNEGKEETKSFPGSKGLEAGTSLMSSRNSKNTYVPGANSVRTMLGNDVKQMVRR